MQLSPLAMCLVKAPRGKKMQVSQQESLNSHCWEGLWPHQLVRREIRILLVAASLCEVHPFYLAVPPPQKLYLPLSGFHVGCPGSPFPTSGGAEMLHREESGPSQTSVGESRGTG